MKVEQERGISVTASVMTFDWGDCTFNLLDTPGHQDFSEDTYRTLTAVDSAVMVIDAAKGIETQTRKLFEVCRLRNVPIVTFVNKLDREGRDPFELMDEIEQDLQLHVTPANWPIGMGSSFKGCYDLLRDRLILFDRGHGATLAAGETFHGLADPRLDRFLPQGALEELRESAHLASSLCPPFDVADLPRGAPDAGLLRLGAAQLRRARAAPGPGRVRAPAAPGAGPAESRSSRPRRRSAAFVFKIQANMDPKHRDRIAFARICSGRFARGMKLFHVRSGKTINVHTPVMFLAREREIAEEAYPGDIVGIPNHGVLRIGDALTEGESLRFLGIPSLRPRAAAEGARGRPDEGQAPREGAHPPRRGGRGAGLPHARGQRLDRRRRRTAAVRRARRPHPHRVRPAGRVPENDALHRALARGRRRRASSSASSTATRARSPPTGPARRSSSPPTPTA